MKRGELVSEILQLLREYGPMTRADLCLHLKHDTVSIASVLSRMHRDTPVAGKRVYIRDWVYDAERGKRYPRPVYAIGSATDCPKPQSSAPENSRRYRASKKKRVVNSVWALAAAPRGLKLF